MPPLPNTTDAIDTNQSRTAMTVRITPIHSSSAFNSRLTWYDLLDIHGFRVPLMLLAIKVSSSTVRTPWCFQSLGLRVSETEVSMDLRIRTDKTEHQSTPHEEMDRPATA